MPGTHAKLSPSASHRWLRCPGCIWLSEYLPPEPSSPYAIEGTAAHMLAEVVLTQGGEPEDYIGNIMDTGESNVAVTADMADAVRVYTDLIRSEAEGKQLMVEQPFEVDPDIYGTNDAALLQPFATLEIFDYKHGQGVQVDAEDNSQLMIYGLGALGANNLWLFEDVRLTIVQPRGQGDKIRRCRMTVEALYKWRDEVLMPAKQKVMAARRDINSNLIPGEHCRWCRALAVCPSAGKDIETEALALFDNISVPAPETMTMEDIVRKVQLAERLKHWINAAMAYLTEQAMSGVSVPGYKLVQKKTNRAWISVPDASAMLSTMLGDKAFTDPKLKSPAQIEKILGKKQAEVIQPLVHKPEGALTLAPDADNRGGVEVAGFFGPLA